MLNGLLQNKNEDFSSGLMEAHLFFYAKAMAQPLTGGHTHHMDYICCAVAYPSYSNLG